jgi:hypothetical protein
LPFIRVFFIPLSSIIFFSSFVFVFVVILKGEGGGGGGGAFAAKALILTRKLSSANASRVYTRERKEQRKVVQSSVFDRKVFKKKWRFGEKKKRKKKEKHTPKTNTYTHLKAFKSNH